MNAIRLLALSILAALLSCQSPSEAPTPTPAPSASTAHAPKAQRGHGVVQKPQAPDPRTAQQLAQAACPAGRCSGVKSFAASGSAPIIPPSWTVPAWFIDPANLTACAADTNSGTSATCTGGCAGSVCTSGIGPLLTYQELNVHRWTCQGALGRCPRLRQTTQLTFLSNQTSNADPVYWQPAVENGSVASVVGALGPAQTVVTTTLSAVTPKNRPAAQLLYATFTAGVLATDEFVVNTTHPSRAWIYKNIAGNQWAMSQPMGPAGIPPSLDPGEVDSWAPGDAVTVYTPVQVDIVEVDPVVAEYNGSFSNILAVANLTVFDPTGEGDDSLVVGTHVQFSEAAIQKLSFLPARAGDLFRGYINSDLIGGISAEGPTFVIENGGVSAPLPLQGGILGSSNAFFASMAAADLSTDIIVNMPVPESTCNTQGLFGYVYLESGTTLTVDKDGNMSTGLGTEVPTIWGPGIFDTLGAARITYRPGAGSGAAQFLNTGGIRINGQNLGCIVQPGAAVVGTCNHPAATGANLDAANGATSGCLIATAQFCNYGY